MIDAKLIKGVIMKGAKGERRGAILERMTWDGHDFLDATKDPGVWKKAKEKVLRPGLSWTFGVLL